jgi:hypothetical protein
LISLDERQPCGGRRTLNDQRERRRCAARCHCS